LETLERAEYLFFRLIHDTMANGEVVTDSGTRVDTSAVKEAMGRLKATTDYKTKECYDDLKVSLI